jgi:ABC-type lipopolysaccharide export system ATPase subunit
MVQVGTNVWGHRLDVENWLRAAFASSQQVGHHVTRTGDAVTDELPTGEVVATVASDALRMGEVYAILPRLVGGIAAYLVLGAVLVLIEPTSAVDAHTEARIARRLADARRGATTVVVTASPLVLDVVDEVALVAAGRVVATGTHRDLVTAQDATGAAYRSVVSRADDEAAPADAAPTTTTDEEGRRDAARR